MRELIERRMDYRTSTDVGASEAETVTEWGVEMNATIIGKQVTKVFVWNNREEAERDAAYRVTLSFVKRARVVSREVTTTPWQRVIDKR